MRTRLLAAIAAAALLVTIGALPGMASSAVDVQSNQPQVAGDAGSNTTAVFPTNKQNEPTIAVNPLDPDRLIAGSNDEQLQPPCGPGPVRGPGAAVNDCSFFANVGTDGVYTSSDGGATWTNRGLLPGFSDNGGNLVSDGDPVIVYGPKPDGLGGFTYADGARAYYASLAAYATGAAQGNQAPELLAVTTSDDNGLTWTNPVVAANGQGYKFNDKEAIWVDNDPASPHFGRAYVTWTQFRGIPGCAAPVMVAISRNGGSSWSAPMKLSPSYNCAKGGRQGTTVRTDANGNVYVVWEDSDGGGFKQVISVSHDGGRKWSKPMTIFHIDDIFGYGDHIPGSNFRVDSFATLAVDRNDGSLYVSWSDGMGTGQPTILVTKSTDGGITWTAPQAVSDPTVQGLAFYQGMDVAPNGRVDIAFQAQKATDPNTYGGGNASIDSFYTESTDGGVTWSTPMKVTTKSSDPAASSQNNLERQFWGDYNTLVSTNDTAWFIYTDSRNGKPCAAVDAYQHSVDGSGPAAGKPAVGASCLSQFGNSDAFVSVVTP